LYYDQLPNAIVNDFCVELELLFYCPSKNLGGIHHGLTVAKNHGLGKVIIESDALGGINLFKDGSPYYWGCQ